MTKKVFNEIWEQLNFPNIAIVVDTIESCGGYSSAQTVIEVNQGQVSLLNSCIKVHLNMINKQSLFSIRKDMGDVYIPYKEIKMLIDNYKSVRD